MENYIEQEEKHCPECGREIFGGRTDRKFCGDTCRNRYHSREYGKLRRMKTEIINSLLCNYDILCHLLDSGIDKADLNVLKATGFRDDVMTGFSHGKGGITQISCFNIRYSRNRSRIFALKREEENDSSPLQGQSR